MSVNDEHLAMRRREILTAAEKVFDARGYASTTMEAVAAAAKISKGSLYNYFENKRDLFVQVFTEAIAGDEAETEKLLSERLPATEKLERVLDNWLERLDHYKRIGRLVLESWATAAREQQDGGLGSWFSEMCAHWNEMIAAIVREGIEAGEFRAELDASVAASMIIGVMDGITVHSILDANTNVDEEFLAALKLSTITALTPNSAEGPSTS